MGGELPSDVLEQPGRLVLAGLVAVRAPAVLSQVHLFAVRQYALGAQPLQLVVQQMRRGRAVRAQDAVPGQVVAVLGEDAADQARGGAPESAAMSP